LSWLKSPLHCLQKSSTIHPATSTSPSLMTQDPAIALSAGHSYIHHPSSWPFWRRSVQCLCIPVRPPRQRLPMVPGKTCLLTWQGQSLSLSCLRQRDLQRCDVVVIINPIRHSHFYLLNFMSKVTYGFNFKIIYALKP
jgi:hypothetical protein